jgi:AraC-like DNA-binding protein
MSLDTPVLPFTLHAQRRHPTTCVWRPFPREVTDIVCVEDHGDLEPRIHPWFAITLLRSPAVVTVESKRDVVAERHCVVLIPPFHLHALRAHGEPGDGAVTLLLRGSDFQRLGLPTEAAVVAEPSIGEQMAGLVCALMRPVLSLEHAAAIRPLIEQLVSHGSPLAADRVRRSDPVARVRSHLTTNVDAPVPTTHVARLSGLSEGQVIRAFHFELGLPPHAYHLRVRLAAACELLTRGVAVARVAHECGFADQSHLSRRFKAVYGVTPAVWAAGSTGARGYGAGLLTRDRRIDEADLDVA